MKKKRVHTYEWDRAKQYGFFWYYLLYRHRFKYLRVGVARALWHAARSTWLR